MSTAPLMDALFEGLDRPATHDPGGKALFKLPPGVNGGADLHGPLDCYRDRLWRSFDLSPYVSPYACWIGMNPSTARGDVDDPTVRREWLYTFRTLQLRSMVKVNIGDYRATKPADMVAAASAGTPPCSERNFETILRAAQGAVFVIAAWGGVPSVLLPSMHAMLRAFAERGIELRCLGTTQDGSPRHPSRVRSNTQLQPWKNPCA